MTLCWEVGRSLLPAVTVIIVPGENPMGDIEMLPLVAVTCTKSAMCVCIALQALQQKILPAQLNKKLDTYLYVV